MIWWDEYPVKGYGASQGTTGGLRLYCGMSPDSGQEIDLNKMQASQDNNIWIKGPDGAILRANVSDDNEAVLWDFQSESDLSWFEGLYIAGAHMHGGENDVDTWVVSGNVHYYAKYFISIRSDNPGQENNPEVFFNNPDMMALEIGPFYEPDAEEISSRGAGFHETRRKHKFRVLYKGRPLGGADVTAITNDGWERTETTDSKGIVSIMPFETEEKYGKLLYVVSHRDMSTGEIHCSSLMMHVFTPVSDWKGKVLVFGFYAFGSMCLFVLFVMYRINRRKKLDSKIMLEFERHKINEA